jgi:hypothetical protein
MPVSIFECFTWLCVIIKFFGHDIFFENSIIFFRIRFDFEVILHLNLWRTKIITFPISKMELLMKPISSGTSHMCIQVILEMGKVMIFVRQRLRCKITSKSNLILKKMIEFSKKISWPKNLIITHNQVKHSKIDTGISIIPCVIKMVS